MRVCYVLVKLKILQSQYFSRSVTSLFVGFPRRHRTKDGYARCLFCRTDLFIGRRGSSSLFDHWKTEDHQRLERVYRIQHGLPLLNKSCKRASQQEEAKWRSAAEGQAPVELESTLVVSVAEVVEAETEEEAEDQGSVLDELKTDKLWLSQLLQFFVSHRDFSSMLRALDNLTLSLGGMTSASVRCVNVASCQVTPFCFYMLHISFSWLFNLYDFELFAER